MSNGFHLRKVIRNSIQRKLISVMAGLLFVVLVFDLIIFSQINSMVKRIDMVFASNVSINELTDCLELVQNKVELYLNTKSSTALEDYYRYEQDYHELTLSLNDRNVDNDILILEKNIRNMSETYLDMTEETVAAKRGRNIERYKSLFEQQTELFEYINYYIYELNGLLFSRNSSNYQIMLSSMNWLEVFSICIVCATFLLCLFMVSMIIRTMINPLTHLADAANKVADGNFEIEIPEVESNDEIGIVTHAFRKMVESIRDYIRRLKSSMENEAEMKERELSMEAHLKEAQLKYLQAQINPHFLFNCLNAGAQLAMMEDAEQTGMFMEKMADFFRYNVKKMEVNSTLSEEIEAVDNYIYILNVRYAGDITYEKNISTEIEHVRMPSMILQPIVENAVQHGIHEMMETGVISLSVAKEENGIRVSVRDNGVGMTHEQIAGVLGGKKKTGSQNGNSTGIALYNVIGRLRLYYHDEDLFSIQSDGKGQGTEVTVLLPTKEGEMDV